MDEDSSVIVSNLPEELADVVEACLESTKKGGGKIERFEFDKTNQRAVVTFESSTVAQQLCEQESMVVASHTVYITKASCDTVKKENSADGRDADLIVTETGGDVHSRTVLIEDVPSDLVEFLELHLESKKKGGGAIEKLDRKNGGILVTFEELQVAERLLELGEVNFANLSLRIVKPTHQLDDDDDDDDDDDVGDGCEDRRGDDDDTDEYDYDDVATVATHSVVVVSNIPKSLSRDYLMMFLENSRRSGGGDVTDMQFDQTSATAIVSFASPQVAQSLIDKGAVKYSDGTLLQVSAFTPSDDRNSLCSVEISDIPSNMTQDKLIMFLENTKRSGGGKIAKMQYEEHSRTARVDFEDQKVAADIVQRGKLQLLDGHVLSARWPTAKKGTVVEPRTVEVSGLTKDVSKDILLLYFENETRSGGGTVEDIQIFDDNAAYVTFESSEAAARVAARCDHAFELRTVLVATWPESTSCAVSVTGLASGMPLEPLVWFFENRKRSRGGPVMELYLGEQKDSAVVTFHNHDDAERVAMNQDLKFNDTKLCVKLLRPGRPPTFIAASDDTYSSDTFLFIDLPQRVDTSVLQKYAEKAAATPVDRIVFSCTNPSVALVQYKADPDYHRLLKSLCSWPCSGQMISFRHVLVPTNIQVFNIGSVTKDSLQLYFEHTRSSGGGDIKQFTMNERHGYAIIKFCDPHVLQQVLQREHSFESHQFHVSLYYKELGLLPPGIDSSSQFEAIPSDVVVDCAPEIAGFILHNQALKQKIESLMSQHDCTIQWPQVRKDKLSLHCTVPVNQPDAVFAMLDWDKKCYSTIKQELDRMRCGKVDVSSHVWQQLKQAVSEGRKYGTDEMLVHWDDNTNTVFFSGFHSIVDQFEKEISKIVADLEDELKKKARQVTDRFKLKPHQSRLLDVKDFAKTSSNAKCTVTVSGDEAVFTGESGEVITVRTDMLKLLSGVTSRTLGRNSSAFLTVLGKEPVRKRIKQSMLKKKVFATYSIQDQDANVYSFSDKEAAEAVKIIKAEVVEKKFPVSSNGRACLTSSTWQQFQLDIGKLAVVCQEGSSIVAATVAEEMQALASKVNNFVDRNTVETDFVSMPAGIVDVLQKYAAAEVDQIKHNFNKYATDIRFVSSASQMGCEIIATGSGMTQVVDAVKALELKVRNKDHIVDTPLYVSFLRSPTTRASIDGIAGRHQVSVKFPEETKTGTRSSKMPPLRPVCEVMVGKSKTIRLIAGDITQQAADVIVNAANSRLQHGSGVAGAIARLGGAELNRQCQEYVQQHGSLSCGEVFTSSSGKLPCKVVVHTVGPVWHDGKRNEEKDLEKAVDGALKASRRYETVVLPAVSCGVFGFPHDLAAKITVNTIRDFMKTDSSVSRVDVVVTRKDVISEFHKALAATFGTEKVSNMTLTLASSAADSGDYKTIDSDAGENTDSDDDDDDGDDDSSNKDDDDDDDADDGIQSRDTDDSSDDANDSNGAEFSAAHQHLQGSFKTAEGITVTIVKGSIAAQKVDALFNTTSPDLDFRKGAISKSISIAAGRQLQAECESKYPGGIRQGQVISTSGYQLPCKKVYHGSPQKWDKGAGHSEKTLRNLVSSSLRMATADGMTSVAFPSIGTGHLQFPRTVAARAMFEEVKAFSAAFPQMPISSILFVIYDSDTETLNAFERELTAQVSGKTSRGYGRPGSGHRQPRGSGHDRPHGQGRQSHHKPGQKLSGHTTQQRHRQGAGAKQIRCTVGDVTFTVKSGNITEQNCDAIVNSTDEKLDLSRGAVSSAILKAGGSSIQDECTKLGLTKSMPMVITKAGNLACKFIFHLAPKPDKSSWKSALEHCFQEAEKLQMRSLVLPPVGTGHTGVGDVKTMAGLIFDEVASFAHTKPTHLKSILIVVHQQSMVTDFVSAIEEAEKLDGHPVKKFFGKLKDKIVQFLDEVVLPESDSGSSETRRSQLKRRPKKLGRGAKETKQLVLHFYGMSVARIDSAIQDIEKLCKDAKKQKILKNPQVQAFVSKMTREQEKKLQELGKKHGVHITVMKSKNGAISLEGDADCIASVIDELLQLLLEIKDTSASAREAELLAKQAVWQYFDGKKHKTFGTRGAAALEAAYQEKKPFTEWTDKHGRKHKASLKNWKVDFSGKSFTIRRFEPGKINLPPRWEKMPTGKPMIAVQVKAGSEEFAAVEKRLKASAQGTISSVVKIERIQHPGLYRQYMNRKLEMDKVNGHNPSNERRLWHGTSGSNISNISNRNFNRSYGGVHGLSIGNGVYFASTSAYSVGGYCPADSSGLKYIYQARVLTGKYTRGQGGLKEPPAGFDSVADNTLSPGVFVVFFDAQTYPEYLITFK